MGPQVLQNKESGERPLWPKRGRRRIRAEHGPNKTSFTSKVTDLNNSCFHAGLKFQTEMSDMYIFLAYVDQVFAIRAVIKGGPKVQRRWKLYEDPHTKSKTPKKSRCNDDMQQSSC